MQFKSILAIIFASSALATPLSLDRRSSALTSESDSASNSVNALSRRFVESAESAEAVDVFIGASLLNILGLELDVNSLGRNPYYPTFRRHLLDIELDVGLNRLLNGINGGLRNRRTYNGKLRHDDIYRVLKELGCKDNRLMHHSRTFLNDLLRLNIGAEVDLNL